METLKKRTVVVERKGNNEGDKKIKKQITALQEKIANLKRFLDPADFLITNAEKKLKELLPPEKED